MVEAIVCWYLQGNPGFLGWCRILAITSKTLFFQVLRLPRNLQLTGPATNSVPHLARALRPAVTQDPVAKGARVHANGPGSEVTLRLLRPGAAIQLTCGHPKKLKPAKGCTFWICLFPRHADTLCSRVVSLLLSSIGVPAFN